MGVLEIIGSVAALVLLGVLRAGLPALRRQPYWRLLLVAILLFVFASFAGTAEEVAWPVLFDEVQHLGIMLARLALAVWVIRRFVDSWRERPDGPGSLG